MILGVEKMIDEGTGEEYDQLTWGGDEMTTAEECIYRSGNGKGFVVYVHMDGKSKYVGTFDELEDAVIARDKVKRKRDKIVNPGESKIEIDWAVAKFCEMYEIESTKHKAVCQLITEGMTYREMADELGVTNQAIGNRINQILKRANMSSYKIIMSEIYKIA